MIIITIEDIDFVKESILLNLLLTKLEKDKTIIGQTPIKIVGPYLVMINDTMERVTKDVSSLNKILRNRGIKIYDPHHLELYIKISFLCRGYQDSIVLYWELVRAELEIRLNKYFANEHN
ncbi:hypothetical protein SMD22_01185 (plasmid) [Brevibacillus halotolerans]|nr:hypothetical protein SMD22_01185 [Brevibacillus halotolerans]